MTTDLKPVLMFDSGIGGLTVLREARVLMPERGFIYVADDAGFPYGRWEEEALKARVLDLFERLLRDFRPEVCVIACNTAFTLVGADLRAAFPDMTFVGTVPAIKPAAERTRSGLVSVLATPGTVKRAYTRDLIQSFASRCDVRLVGSENLARMAGGLCTRGGRGRRCRGGGDRSVLRRHRLGQDRYRRSRLHPLPVYGQCLSQACPLAGGLD